MSQLRKFFSVLGLNKWLQVPAGNAVVSHSVRADKGVQREVQRALFQLFTSKKMYHINYASRCCRTEKMVVFSSLLSLFYCAVPLAEGHRLPSFWWNANGVQRCVKTHKQHLQEWQPGIPSAPCSPSKSAHVCSHLLRPSALLPLPCFFHCCCLIEEPSFIATVDLAQARLIRRSGFT